MSKAAFKFNDAMSENDDDGSVGGGSIVSESFYKFSSMRDTFRGPQRSGYLYKMIDIGSYKRRYFETNGFYLTYFKSKKKVKLLAALNMRKVDKVGMLTELPEGHSSEDSHSMGCFFQIEVSGNIYILRGASPSDTSRWVRVLTDLQHGVETDSTNGDDDDKQGLLGATPTNKAKQTDKSNKTSVWDDYFAGVCCFVHL